MINIEEHTKDIRKRQFESMAEHFFDRWQPADPREASRFSADLFSLVRQIYIDALEPQQKLARDLLSVQISPHFLKGEIDGK